MERGLRAVRTKAVGLVMPAIASLLILTPWTAWGQTSCPAPLTLCGGVCTNLLTDAKNCGACGNVCSLANATAYCSSGLCWVESCSFGWADCDGVYWNGCEISLLTDAKNCGRCNSACPGGTACSGGQCR